MRTASGKLEHPSAVHVTSVGPHCRIQAWSKPSTCIFPTSVRMAVSAGAATTGSESIGRKAALLVPAPICINAETKSPNADLRRSFMKQLKAILPTPLGSAMDCACEVCCSATVGSMVSELGTGEADDDLLFDCVPDLLFGSAAGGKIAPSTDDASALGNRASVCCFCCGCCCWTSR